jgi:DNA-3-methyladenine glycosylase II
MCKHMGYQQALSKRTVIEAEKYLSQSCNVIARLIALYGPCSLADRKFRPFQTLATSIISQQLSAKAANTIERRVRAIVPSFTPTGFLAVSPEALRAAGLSSAKARYIVELAQCVSDGRLNLEAMQYALDADVIAALVELPGIGQWTAEMFLIFGLCRPDVLPLRDAGLQRAARLLFGEDVTLERVAQPWRPYCSVASWYLWRHLDV